MTEKEFELPGYEILEKIGEGGTSSVWKARQLSLDRLVAIKTLFAHHVPDQEAMARFRQEAQAAASLKHPGIVQVYDAGEANGRPYLVMEYIGGCTVGDLIERAGKLTERNALLIVDGVAQALAYAWDKDCIIHLDVKPDNVLVEADGSIKVADLGLARFIGLHRRRQEDDSILGTPNYVSPEQSEGVADLDCRTDIYSLGAMLYHLVTGRLPFGGRPGSAAMDAHVMEFLPDPMDLNAELSPAAAWFIEKLMVKNRAYRPAYWSVVLSDLAQVREGNPPHDPLPEVGQSTVLRSPARKRPTPPAARTVVHLAKPAGPKKRINLKGGASATQPGTERYYEDPGIGRVFTQLAIVVGVLAVVWVFVVMKMPEKFNLKSNEPPAQHWDIPVPNVPHHAEPVRVSAPRPSAPAVVDRDEPPVQVDWGDEAPAERKPVAHDAPVTWENEDFREGARAFNEAYKIYMEFQKTRENRDELPHVESLAREAIKKFESVVELAPPDVDVKAYIQQCYHLVSDVRHSTLTERDEPKRPGRRIRPPDQKPNEADSL